MVHKKGKFVNSEGSLGFSYSKILMWPELWRIISPVISAGETVRRNFSNASTIGLASAGWIAIKRNFIKTVNPLLRMRYILDFWRKALRSVKQPEYAQRLSLDNNLSPHFPQVLP